MAALQLLPVWDREKQHIKRRLRFLRTIANRGHNKFSGILCPLKRILAITIIHMLLFRGASGEVNT